MRFRNVALLAAGVMASSSVFAGIVSGFDANTLAKGDDNSSGLVNMGFSANFFGNEYSQLYVNNNGNITFDAAQSTYTPYGLATTNRAIIAPFFADVDTRYSGSVTYGTGTYDGQAAFGVTWRDVSYYGASYYGAGSLTDQLNSFQVILVDRAGGNFDVVFNYGDIQWEAGLSSGGLGGLGGISAYAGWSNGTGEAGSFHELTGSGVNGAFLTNGANLLASYGENGVMFHVVNGQVTAPLPAVPEPDLLVMLLSGLGVVGVAARRRRK